MLSLLSQYKTYAAAVGLIGLAVYQASQGQVETAFTTLLGAGVAAGLRHETAPVKPPSTPTPAPASSARPPYSDR